MAEAAATALASNRVNRRLAFVRWVRRTHGWFGLWGALLGLMMGFSGVWLNHRNVMKLQLPDQQQINAQLALPDPRPATIDAMAAWLQQALKVDRPANNMRVERVAAGAPGRKRGGAGRRGRPLMQPERWTFNFGGPNKVIQVEYWVGNKSVGVRTTRERLHRDAHQPAQGHRHAGAVDPADRHAGRQPDLPVDQRRHPVVGDPSPARRRDGDLRRVVAVTVALALSPLQS